MKKLFLFSGIVLILLSSCTQSTVFREYKKMKNVSWNRFDILEFEVPVEKDYVLDFELAFRHHTYFPYDKLFVNITFYSPGSDFRSADYEFELKDEEGNWLADGMGELWDINFPIRNGMRFSEAGICKVRIENSYSKFETPGVIEVGLVVKRSAD